jgi:hypothetical protein
MNKLIIKFILLFNSLWQRLGVDTDQLKVILTVKLLMDDRRPNLYMGGGHKTKKESKHSSLVAMFFMFLMGVFMAFILAISGNPMMGHSFFFSIFMVMIALTLISDFTSVLIDVRDNNIILPRPVNDVTFSISRILHISAHVSKLVFAIAVPAFIYILVKVGFIASIAFVIETISAAVLSIFVVNMIYLIVLKITSPERFKNFISYFQIAFSIVVFAAYQFLPRLVNSDIMKDFDILSYKISYLLPSVWLAAFYDILVNPKSFSLVKLGLAFLGIVMPFVSMIFVVKVLAPGFNKKLSGISGSAAETNEETSVLNQKPEISIANRLSTLLSKDTAEQAGFRLTWLLTSRYRDFKLKVYPSFAYVPVYFVYFAWLKQEGPMADRLNDFKQGSGYIFLTYLTSFVILTVLGQISISEKYKSAWVMFSTPHNKPGKIISGMFKAIIIKYFMPFYLIITAISLYFWGTKVINDLLFAFFNILIYALIMAVFTVKHLPFSQPVSTSKQSGKVIVNLMLMSVIGILGFSHYALSRWEWVITSLLVLSAGACAVIFYFFRKRDWKAMEADYS